MSLSDVQPHVCTWLVPALLTPLVILQAGYSYGEPNHVIELPWVIRRVDPSLLANDWFSNTFPGHPNGVAFAAFVSRFVPLPLALALLHLLTIFFLLYAAQKLILELCGDRRVFFIGIFLLLRWGTEGLGNNPLWANCVVPHTVAAPLCLLAFYLALKDRPLATALVCAAATWIHIQLGALTMLVLGAGMMLGWRRTGLRPILLAGGAYLAAVAPTVIPQWLHFMQGPELLAAPEYLKLHAIFRQPHHLIPSSWPAGDYYRFLVVLILAAGGFEWPNAAHRRVLAWTAIILALCLAGYVFVEVLPVKLIIRLQLFRLTKIGRAHV